MSKPDKFMDLASLITQVARLQRTVFDRRVRKTGFTRSQWLALCQVADHSGVSQSELSELLKIETPSVGRLIDKLEIYGWLERRPDQDDRRVKRVYLTNLGRRIHDDVTPVAELLVEEELCLLTYKERETFLELMLAVKGQLQEMAGDDQEIGLEDLTKGIT